MFKREHQFAALFTLLLFGSLCFAQTTAPAKNSETLAVVGDQPISDDDLLPYVQGQLRPLREQEYQIKKKALDNLINQRLLEAEAKKRGLSTEKLLEQEVDSKVADPTDAEVNTVYTLQKDQLNRPFEDVKVQLQQNTGALIHYEDPTTGTYTHVLDFTPSDVGRWYNTVLAPGQSWTDPYSNVSISVLGATASGLTVSVTYGGASCTSSAPGVTFSPLNPSIYPGQNASYTVSVTNNDSTACSASTINLGSSEPSGWSTSLSSSSLTLGPGQSGSVTMSKGAPSGTPTGTYAVNLNASNSSASGMGTANATVMTPPSQTVSVSVSGSSFIPPSTVPITASVTNGGAPASGASVTFTLTAPNGSTTTQSATTGSNGMATWSYKLNSRSLVGTYLVGAQAGLSSGSKKAASTQSATSTTVTFSVQ
jgi:hypothetical protein